MQLKRIISLGLSIIMIVASNSTYFAETEANYVNYTGILKEDATVYSSEASEDKEIMENIDNNSQKDILSYDLEKIAKNLEDSSINLNTADENTGSFPAVGGNVYYNKPTGAIIGCDTGVTAIEIPESNEIKSIAATAFRGKDIETIKIPGNVKTIGSNAFEFCENLREVEIGDGVEEIGMLAFHVNYKLKEIYLPKSVKKIGGDFIGYMPAFFKCFALEKIEVDEQNENFKDIGGVLFSKDESKLWLYPPALTASEYTIPDKVKILETTAFERCENLQYIKLPNNLEKINTEAFRCPNLKRVEIPKSVTKIGNAFIDCDSLTIYCYKDTEGERYVKTYGIYPYKIIKDESNQYRYDVEGGSIHFDTETRTITGYDGNITSIDIPDNINGTPVEYIGKSAFSYCSSLKSIKIPKTVTNIEDYAFYHCDNLAGISIPDVTNLGKWAFGYCGSLKYATFSNNINIENLKEYTFYKCSSLEKITVPENVTNIEKCVFQYCSNLTSIKLPDNLEIMGDGVFADSNLSSIEIPETVKKIGDLAFSDCTNLKKVVIPYGITKIGDNTFDSCINLINVTIPDSVTYIGYKAFANCESLPYIMIPKSVRETDILVFDGCSSLKALVIPKNMTTVKYMNFRSCSSLEDVIISDGVKTIENSVFERCPLKNITIPKSVEKIGINNFNKNSWIYCYKDSAAESYAVKNNISYKIIDENDEENQHFIGNRYFVENGFIYYDPKTGEITGCDNSITYADIPEVIKGTKIKGIGKKAFSSSNLKSIVLPDSIEYIKDNAFKDCKALLNIKLSDDLTYIGNNAFEGCHTLKSITIPKNVTSIGECAFRRCYYLKEINVHNENNMYTSLKGILFSKDKKTLLTCPESFNSLNDKYIIPNDVEAIGNYAFYNCSLDEITIPNTVTSIGKYAFYNCSNLKYMTIPGSVISIGDSAFEACNLLFSVELLDGVASIGKNILKYCPSLKVVRIPDSITNIPYNSIDVIGKNYCIYCYENSAAYEYAKKWNIKYKIIEKNTATESTTENTTENITESITEASSGNVGGKYQVTGGFIYYDADGTITHCDKEVISADIPEIIGNVHIKSIGDSAFTNCAELKEISIPDSVENIGSFAFFNCMALENITIPKGVKSIGEACFLKCESLTYIDTAIDNEFFESENGILFNKGKTEILAYPADMENSSYDLPYGVTSIRTGAFRNNHNIKSITLPESINNIGNEAFFDSHSLINIYFNGDSPKLGTNVFNSKEDSNFNEDFKLYYYEGKNWSGISDKNTWNGYPIEMIPKSQMDISTESTTEITTENIAEGTTEEVSYSDENDFEFDESSGTITKYKGTSENVVIPHIIKGINVTALGNEAFLSNEIIKAVKIPEGVTSIGKKAFAHCENLKNIDLPEELISLKEGAFLCCNNLNNIILPNKLSNIEESAFFECGNLTSIEIPDSVTNIGNSVFCGCVNLINVKLPRNLNNIGLSMFTNCYSLTNIEIPKSVKKIDQSTFSKCYSLRNIEIPEEVKEIEFQTFSECINLTNVKLPVGLTKIETSAFLKCGSLKNITIPKSVTNIEYGAFYNCSNLESVCFEGNNPNQFGNNVFKNCSDNFKIYYYEGKNWLGISDNNTWNGYPIEMIPKDQTENSTENTTEAISENMTEDTTEYISYSDENDFEFDENSGTITKYNGTAEDVIIPPMIKGKSVTGIGDRAFGSNQTIKTVIIPEGVVNIGGGAFGGCFNLRSANIPDSVKSIGVHAFLSCALENLTIPKNVTYIGEQAFFCCDSLTNIDVSNYNEKYTSINGVLFNKEGDTILLYPAGLKEPNYTIPEAVNHIRWFAFLNCNNLKKITIPKNIDNIEGRAFSGCDNLTDVYFEGNVPDKFGTDAFANCSKDFKIYYYYGAEGFESPIWNGYNTIPMYEEIEITGVSGTGDIIYDGEAKTGYTGTPTNDKYTGEYEITYSGRNNTKYDKTTAPIDVGDYEVTIKTSKGQRYAGEVSFDFSILKSEIEFENGIKIYDNNNQETNKFTYGEVINVSVKPRAKGEVSAINSERADKFDNGQMALFIGENQISETINADENGIYFMTADTKDKNFVIDENDITVKHMGSDNIYPYEEHIIIILNKKETTIDGVKTVGNIAYNGMPQSGYYGEPKSDEYNYKDYDMTYMGINSTKYNSKEAPINAGDYRVIFTIPDDKKYTGSISLDFSIIKEENPDEDDTENSTVVIVDPSESENSIESTTESTIESSEESSSELTTESTTELPEESSSESITESATESLEESSSELTTESTTELLEESFSELTTENSTESNEKNSEEESNSELTTESTIKDKDNFGIIIGDADGDNNLTINDAVCVLQKVLDPGSILPVEKKIDNYMMYADVDNNGILTASDAASIIQKVLNSNFIFLAEK